MSFETIVGILLSALIPKIFEKIQLKKGILISKIFKLCLILFVFLTFFLLNNNILPKFLNVPEINKFYLDIIQNVYFQIAVYIVLGILLLVAYSKKSNADYCTYYQLVKKITKFTDKVTANGILYVICGNMDVAWDFSDGDSKEFKQLKEIVEEVQEIRILCKHGMTDELIDEIRNDTFDVNNILNDTRSNKSQIERIVKFKKELGDKCIFRFYDRDKDDFSNLRARVIVSDRGKEALIYYHNRITKRKIYTFLLNKFPKRKNIINMIENRMDYSYEYCDFSEITQTFQQRHYIELCEMKWNACDKTLGEHIETYCLEYEARRTGKVKSNIPTIKKIAFVYAKTYEVAHFKEKRKEFPPFGVMYLAAMVKKYCANWVPSIISIEENDFEIDINKYDIIAFSVISAYTVPLFEKCLSDLYIQKNEGEQIRRRCVCVAGGYQAELESEKWLNDGWVEFVLSGEGERQIVSLLEEYSKGFKNIRKISGISYLKNKKIINNDLVKGCIDLDDIPFPARELLPEEDYIMNDRLAGTGYKMVHVLFSRGCQNNCFYCGVPKGRNNNVVRYRSAQNIVKELEELKIKDIEGFSIIDDCFLTDQVKAIEIIRAVGKVGLKWSLAARVDQINETIVNELKASNCLEIKLGLETGSDTLLEKMNKQCTVEDAKRAIRLIRSYEISVKAFIITGLPFETKITNEETKKFLKEMGKNNINRISLLRFVPLPGSYIYNNPQKFGLKSNFSEQISYKSYRLYDETADWWEDNKELQIRNEIYVDIRNFMLTIWNEI